MQHSQSVQPALFAAGLRGPDVLSAALGVLLVGGLWIVLRCRSGIRGTTLTGAWAWAVAAVLIWCGAVATTLGCESLAWCRHARYAAAIAAVCPLVAVLGARRPMAGAWNFVVLGLVAVLAMPSVETLRRGPEAELVLDGPRSLFAALVIAVGVMNYLPTRYAPAALMFGAAEVCQLVPLSAWTRNHATAPENFWNVASVALVAAIAVAWLRAVERRVSHSRADRLWLAYRDSFGLVWGRRLQDRFNVQAANANWPVQLTWLGLRPAARPSAAATEGGSPTDVEKALRHLLARFAGAEWIDRQLSS